ncbi:MAG: DUF6620 family protein, partial [Weeksellaceae bacterium]
MENNQEFEGGYNPEDGMYYAKGSYDNEIEYNNEVICLVNHTDEYFAGLSQAMQERRFNDVNTILDELIAVNQNNVDALNQLGAYEGDDTLLNTAKNYLNELNGLLENNYKKTVEMLKEGGHSQQDLVAQQEAFNTKLQDITTQLSTALQEFLEKYSEEEEEDDEMDFFGDMHMGMEVQEHDPNNPFLQPIHGISIEDYAAASAKMANGMTEDEVAKALGVERPQWDEANQLWQQRMQQDTDMTVIGLFGQYFAMADNHPKFQDVESSSFETNEENLARIKEDPEFHFELTAAMQAAYNYGIDGAQWLTDNYGLSLGEFQSVAMQWAYTPVYA